MKQLDIPVDWDQAGELIDVDTRSLGPESSVLDELGEDIWTVATPDNEVLIDVGWYPKSDPSGHFMAQIVVDCDWSQPIETFETRDFPSLYDWLVKAIERVRKMTE